MGDGVWVCVHDPAGWRSCRVEDDWPGREKGYRMGFGEMGLGDYCDRCSLSSSLLLSRYYVLANQFVEGRLPGAEHSNQQVYLAFDYILIAVRGFAVVWVP